jgi:hypothetical protein
VLLGFDDFLSQFGDVEFKRAPHGVATHEARIAPISGPMSRQSTASMSNLLARIPESRMTGLPGLIASVLYFPFRRTTLISPSTCRNKRNFCGAFGTFVGLAPLSEDSHIASVAPQTP